MTNLIDTVNDSLAEIEEQMLAEFSRIRNTVSEHRFGAMDTGIKNALLEVLAILHHDLEHSGDNTNLALLSTQQENLFTRMVIIRQLLNARIPTAFLHEAHENVETSRQPNVPQGRNARQHAAANTIIKGVDLDTDSATGKSAQGLMHLLRSMFTRKSEDPDFKRKRLYVTEQEAKILVEQEIYLDKGAYSAAQELAMLAGMIADETAQHGKNPESAAATSLPAGKAIFESKDVSAKATPANDIKPVRPTSSEVARSPDAIRQKLASRQTNQAAGKANFNSRDIEPLKGRATPQIPAASSTGRASFSSRDIEPAASRDVVAPPVRETPPVTTGRATFASRDIEPAVPSQPPQRRAPQPTLKPAPEPPKPSGKAIFESRDVGQQPTK
ncbi:MAG: hypothetical protein ACI96P_001409 [Candidatus Azotimanducaceae bacterium]|jgi:hypothetical protein